METNAELSGLAQAAETDVKSTSKGLVFKTTDLGEVTQDRREENSDRSLGSSTLRGWVVQDPRRRLRRP